MDLCWHEGDVMTYTFSQAIRMGFSNTFDFKGRATRSEFWWFTLFFVLAYIGVGILDHFAVTPIVDLKDFFVADYLPLAYIDPNVGLLTLLYRPVMAIPTLSVTVRRLHDVNRSGWYSLLWVLPVPVLGWFWLIPMLKKPSAS